MKSFSAYERKVNFVDTDLAGIVHYTNILRFVEEAEHAAMLSIGVPPAAETGGFPKVHVDCDYRSPLRFDEVAMISLEIVRVGEKSLTWNFQVKVDERLVAEGSMVTAYVTAMGEPSALPQDYKEAIS